MGWVAVATDVSEDGALAFVVEQLEWAVPVRAATWFRRRSRWRVRVWETANERLRDEQVVRSSEAARDSLRANGFADPWETHGKAPGRWIPGM